jgi:8-oxo-dGTP pyrophosphatase MutT (NUDIX family)
VATRREFSAGGVVVRPSVSGFDVALAARRTRRGNIAWGLPKGMIEPDEDARQTAIREVREETGLEAAIREPLGDISYWYVWDSVRVQKKVTFFLMDSVGGDISKHDHEMEEIRWFPMGEAEAVASYSGEREMIRRAAGALGAR